MWRSCDPHTRSHVARPVHPQPQTASRATKFTPLKGDHALHTRTDQDWAHLPGRNHGHVLRHQFRRLLKNDLDIHQAMTKPPTVAMLPAAAPAPTHRYCSTAPAVSMPLLDLQAATTTPLLHRASPAAGSGRTDAAIRLHASLAHTERAVASSVQPP
jgi:hypothetical protein